MQDIIFLWLDQYKAPRIFVESSGHKGAPMSLYSSPRPPLHDTVRGLQSPRHKNFGHSDFYLLRSTRPYLPQMEKKYSNKILSESNALNSFLSHTNWLTIMADAF